MELKRLKVNVIHITPKKAQTAQVKVDKLYYIKTNNNKNNCASKEAINRVKRQPVAW